VSLAGASSVLTSAGGASSFVTSSWTVFTTASAFSFILY